jgi:hypothetical protein
VPNPSGVNGFTPPTVEVPYGDAEMNAAVQRSAPLAGAQETAHAANTPRRSQRQAARGESEAAPATAGPPPQLPGQPGNIDPQAEVALFWQQAAQIPGASPLVQQIAAEATHG